MFFENLQTPVLRSGFNGVADFQESNFIKKRLQHRCFLVEFMKFLRTPSLKSVTASETCFFTQIALFNNLHLRLKLVHTLQFLYHDLRFRLPIPPSLKLILQRQSPSGVLQKWCSYIFSKFHKKTSKNKDSFLMKLQIQSLTLSKKSLRHRWFFCEFCEISLKTSLKTPFGRMFLHNIGSVCFPTTTLCLFINDITHIFWLSIFSA